MKRLITAIAIALTTTSANAVDWEKRIDKVVSWNNVSTFTSTMADDRDTGDFLQNQIKMCHQSPTIVFGEQQVIKVPLPDGRIRIYAPNVPEVIYVKNSEIVAYGAGERGRAILERDVPRWLAGDLTCKPMMGTKKHMEIDY